MKFGIFDHVDDSGLPLAEHLAARLEMVEAFDVDFLSGMSLGVFVLENANVNVVRTWSAIRRCARS